MSTNIQHVPSTRGRTCRETSQDSIRSPDVRTATIAIECASSASVLRLWPVSNSRTRPASLAGTSSTRSPASTSRCASGRPAPLAPSISQIRCGHALHITAHLRIAGLVGAEPARPEQPRVRVDPLDRCRQLVGVDPDDHFSHRAPASSRTDLDGEVGSATTSWAVPS